MMIPCCISLVGMSGMTKAASSAIAEYLEAEVIVVHASLGAMEWPGAMERVENRRGVCRDRQRWPETSLRLYLGQ